MMNRNSIFARCAAFAATLISVQPALAQELLVCSLLSDQVLRYDGATGAFLGVFASGATVNGPQSVVVGPDGNVYVASEYSSNISKWSPTGTYLGDFVAPGTAGLTGPQRIRFGADGDLYAISHITTSSSVVWKFDGTTGAFISLVGPGAGPGHTHGMAFRSDDHLFVGILSSSHIHQFGPFGTTDLGPFAISPSFAIASDLEFGPDGNLYVSNPLVSGMLVGGIERYNGTTGAFMDTFSTIGAPSPTWGMAFNGSYMYYTAGSGVARVGYPAGGTASAFVTPGSGGLDSAAGIAFLTPVPEPEVWFGFALGVAAMAMRRLRKRST